MEVKMTKAEDRLWGIDVIAGIYGLATLLSVWLYFGGTPAGQGFALILGPVSAILCVGMVYRVNSVRIALMVLLAIVLVGDGLLSLYFLAALSGAVRVPSNKDPSRELLRLPWAMAATAAMLFYLRRPTVRDAFRKAASGTSDNTAL